MNLDIWDELCGGIVSMEENSEKSAKLLRDSAFRKYSWLKMEIYGLLGAVSRLMARKQKRPAVAFLIRDNLELAKSLWSDFDLYFINPSVSEMKFCLKNRIPFEQSNPYCHKWFYNLYYHHKEKEIKSEIKKISNRLINYKCKFMLVPDDEEMIFRLYLLAGKLSGVKSATILHGLMFEQKAVVGTYSDYMFLWGEYYRKFYSTEQNKFKNIVMGYPYQIHSDLKKVPHQKKQILFIGQPLEGFIEDVVRMVYRVCEDAGYQFLYRFHPGDNKKEIRKKYQDLDQVIYCDGNLVREMTDADVIAGLTSTVLTEALIYHKNVVQIDVVPDAIDFSVIGKIQVVKNSYCEIQKALASDTEGMEVLNPDYLYINKQYHKDVAAFIKNHIL